MAFASPKKKPWVQISTFLEFPAVPSSVVLLDSEQVIQTTPRNKKTGMSAKTAARSIEMGSQVKIIKSL